MGGSVCPGPCGVPGNFDIHHSVLEERLEISRAWLSLLLLGPGHHRRPISRRPETLLEPSVGLKFGFVDRSLTGYIGIDGLEEAPSLVATIGTPEGVLNSWFR